MMLMHNNTALIIFSAIFIIRLRVAIQSGKKKTIRVKFFIAMKQWDLISRLVMRQRGENIMSGRASRARYFKADPAHRYLLYQVSLTEMFIHSHRPDDQYDSRNSPPSLRFTRVARLQKWPDTAANAI